MAGWRWPWQRPDIVDARGTVGAWFEVYSRGERLEFVTEIDLQACVARCLVPATKVVRGRLPLDLRPFDDLRLPEAAPFLVRVEARRLVRGRAFRTNI